MLGLTCLWSDLTLAQSLPFLLLRRISLGANPLLFVCHGQCREKQAQATCRKGHLKPHLSRKLGFEGGQGVRGHL